MKLFLIAVHAKGALMHYTEVKIMDGKQCQQTLADKFADSLPNYSTNTLCGFSDIDQCKVRNNIDCFKYYRHFATVLRQFHCNDESDNTRDAKHYYPDIYRPHKHCMRHCGD